MKFKDSRPYYSDPVNKKVQKVWNQFYIVRYRHFIIICSLSFSWTIITDVRSCLHRHQPFFYEFTTGHKPVLRNKVLMYYTICARWFGVRFISGFSPPCRPVVLCSCFPLLVLSTPTEWTGVYLCILNHQTEKEVYVFVNTYVICV